MSGVKNQQVTPNIIRQIPIFGWILIFICIADIIFGIVLAVNAPGLLSSLYSITTLASAFIVIFALYFYLKAKKDKAALWIVIGAVFHGVVAALILDRAGIPMQVFMLVISGITLLEWVSGAVMLRAIPAIFITSLIAIATDMIQPIWRIESYLYPLIFTMVVLVFIILHIMFNFRKFPFQIKMILAFLGLTSVSIIGIALATYILAQNALLENARFTLRTSAQSVAESVDKFISSNKLSIQSDTSSPELAAYLALPESERSGTNLAAVVDSLLNTFVQRNPLYIESYALLDDDGFILVDTFPIEIGKDQSIEPYFVEPFISGKTFVSDVNVSPATNESYIIFSSPVRDVDNQIVGILRARYKAEILQSLISKANGLGGNGSYGVILDPFNTVLAHGTEPELIQKSFSHYNLPVFWGIVGRQNYTEETKFIRNLSLISSAAGNPKQVTGYMESITENPWRIFYVEPLESFQAPLDQQTNIIILIAESSVILVIVIGSYITRIFTEPITNLTKTAEEMAKGNLQIKSTIKSQDEIGSLANILNTMSAQLVATQTTLESRIHERTRAIESAVQVGHMLSTILDAKELATRVVSELQNTFGYYHVLLYLFEKNRNELVLTGGTGEAGEMLLRENHKIAVGSGLVGITTLTRTVNLVQDTHQEPTWMPNPLLPDTQAEIAVPILLGGEVLGVLDVQQNLPNSLTQQDSDLLQLIANQVAISLRNARLYNFSNEHIAMQSTIQSIVNKVQATTSIEAAVRVAAEELSRYTAGRHIEVRLQVSDHSEDSSPLPVLGKS